MNFRLAVLLLTFVAVLTGCTDIGKKEVIKDGSDGITLIEGNNDIVDHPISGSSFTKDFIIQPTFGWVKVLIQNTSTETLTVRVTQSTLVGTQKMLFSVAPGDTYTEYGAKPWVTGTHWVSVSTKNGGNMSGFLSVIMENTEAAPGVESDAAESSPAISQGEPTTDLMPIDLTLTKSDVPNLIDKLNASKYRAVYMDNEMYLRVTNDNSILISKDNGAVWKKYDTEDVSAKDFANWLLKNDPNPGYSIKEIQSRLANGAEVKHLVLENGKEMYFIIYGNGVQIELVQPEKIASVLVDGQRMMITSEGSPTFISAQMLKSFYDLLVSNNILTKTQAEQDYSERIKYFKENDTIFTVTK